MTDHLKKCKKYLSLEIRTLLELKGSELRFKIYVNIKNIALVVYTTLNLFHYKFMRPQTYSNALIKEFRPALFFNTLPNASLIWL